MPTSVLRNKSPFETLFHQPPNYGFLRTFGCLCFPFLRPYNAYKLDYRSTPCMFLGYSSCHLGYRCLDLSSDRIYISRHVRFHENSFPFIESTRVPATTNSNPQPTPISYLPTLTSFPSSNPPQTPILSPHTSVPYHHLQPCLLIILQVQVLLLRTSQLLNLLLLLRHRHLPHRFLPLLPRSL